jgi:hypothetical protein
VLTPGEVQRKRLELAAEMVELLLSDDELVGRPRRTLEQIYVSLGHLRGQVRR